jgi:hypothetical protein
VSAVKIREIRGRDFDFAWFPAYFRTASGARISSTTSFPRLSTTWTGFEQENHNFGFHFACAALGKE